MLNRRKFLLFLSSTFAWFLTPARAQSDDYGGGRGGGRGGRGGGGGKRRPEDYSLPSDLAAFGLLSLVLGRITDRSVTVSAYPKETLEGYFEYSPARGSHPRSTLITSFPAGKPVEAVFDNLMPNTEYYYRFHYRKPGATAFDTRTGNRFHTQRPPGSAFTFGIQGDSHPERPQMNDPELYARTLLNVASRESDFYICMGDDFSVQRLRSFSAGEVAQCYTLQRPFLGLVGQSAPIFLLNGNHEQASLYNYNQSGIPHEVAVWAQNARNPYFPTPAPDGFYTGNSNPLNSIGLMKDYCAWTWGDALFVILDNYWHSPAPVDSQLELQVAGGGVGGQERHDERDRLSHGPLSPDEVAGPEMGRDRNRDRDWWGITIGDDQYHWFKRTLEESTARYKFVFAHHVLGTQRGGIEVSDLYEWGGRNRRGDWEFPKKRPGWELPIHQLMVKHGVTIFFQGHDHLFAKQERDGIIYQEVPMPADPFYEARNEERYESGVKLPKLGSPARLLCHRKR